MSRFTRGPLGDDPPQQRREHPKFHVLIISPPGRAPAPRLPQAVEDQCRKDLGLRFRSSPGNFQYRLLSHSAATLEMTWRRIGPASWSLGWNWMGEICAVSMLLGGNRDSDDAQILREGMQLCGIAPQEQPLEPIRRCARPLLCSVFVDPRAIGRTPIAALACLMAEVFYERLEKTPARPPLGEADPPYFPPLYELRLFPGAKRFDERWFSFPVLGMDPQIAAFSQVLETRLAEGAEQFTERLAIAGFPELCINWSALGKTAAFVVRQYPGAPQEQLLLFLSGLDAATDRAAIEAFVNTVMVSQTPHSRKWLLRLIDGSPRPMILNITRQPATQTDGIALAMALTYFRRIGVALE